MICIKNAKPIPAKFFTRGGKLKNHVLDLYNGCEVLSLPSLLVEDFRPIGGGAGAAEMEEH